MPADLITRLFIDSQWFDRNIEKSGKQVDNFKKRSKGLYDQMAAVNGRLDALGNGFSKFAGNLGRLAAGATAAMGVSTALSDIVQKSMEFEKSLSSLRSITGLSADEMKYFQQQAIALGSTSTQTASQVVEAFQLIGGQKSELLDNKEALVEVTRQAITLAEAAGMDVPEAAKALTGSLNQMGESADKAGEYVNILAAASQAGSAEIPYLTKAIERSGGAASTVGVKYNELVAAIEAIAPKITEASEAGTGLRNIFLTLESSADDNLRPSVVGLTAALENLAAKNLDATQMTKMFGKENVTAALAIVKAKDEYNGFLEAITGTNTALEQQRINNDNLAGSIKSVSNAWEGLVLSINKSNGFLKTTVDGLADTLRGITDMINGVDSEKYDGLGDKIVGNFNRIYNENISDGIPKERSLQLAAIEYNSTEGSKINAIHKEIESLTTSLEELERRRQDLAGRPGYYNHKERGEVLTAIADTKERIALLREELKVRQEADAKIRQLIYNPSSGSTGTGNAVVSPPGGAGEQDKGKAAVEGSIAYLDERLKEWRDIFYTATTAEARKAAQTMIDKIQEQKIALQFEAKYDDIGKLPILSGNMGGGSSNGRNSGEDIKPGYISVKPIESDTIQSNYDYADSISAIGNVMSSVTRLTDEGAASWLSYAGNVIKAVAQALPQLSALASKNAAVAATGAASSVASIPVVGWIMAASAVASVIAAMTNIPKFANGGIVPGNMFSGDRVPVMANSGEMILNRAQQNNLFRILNEGGNAGGRDVNVTGQVVVTGEQMRILLANTDRKMRRGR